LNTKIEQLQAELAWLQVDKTCLEVTTAGHRADFERERERCDILMTEALTPAKVAMSAREKAARLQGELRARQVRPRWLRFVAPNEGRDLPSRNAQPLAGVPVRI
jgi:hypothetical protein